MKEFDASFPVDDQPVGIYIHIPFCRKRCNYCAFVTNPHNPALEKRYAESVIQEMSLWRQMGPEAQSLQCKGADTVYFGGGTPSLIGSDLLIRLLITCRETIGVAEESEISLEINPATADLASLRELRRSGFNRASLGVQSLQDRELALMGRLHSAKDAIRAFEDLRAAGFDNVSVDLIAGYPGQSPDSIRTTLERVVELGPDHLSVYLLELKEGTELDKQIRRGDVPPIDEDLAADMYEEFCSCASTAGYVQYEISNFAGQGKVCRHNLKYWQDEIYLGFGAGAHGMTGRTRYANIEDLAEYKNSVKSGRLPLASLTQMRPETRFKDALIMGLRLVEGLNLSVLGERYGVEARSFVLETIGDLLEAGLLALNGDRVSLTPRGRLLSNIVFSRWI
jgi:oxygen-independent coproporphyrinogen-3 oxidase